MTNDESKETISFADLVRRYRIEIPIIQRDYAQGRENPKAAEIRTKFVSDLLAHLEEGADIHNLAFVYGRVNNGVFVPLDGQQRLTTLFLLHLYLVKRCMNGHECVSCKYMDSLSRFTYATRQSSREFCEAVTSPEKQIVPANDDLKQYLFDQYWFFVEWESDPTIQGMVNVLQEIHSQVNSKDFADERARIEWCVKALISLHGNSCPIKFHFLDMEQHGLTDDLYLKMNARGLPLTAFESLKCSLESYCDSHDSKNQREKLFTSDCHLPNIMSSVITENEWATMSIGKRLSRLFDGAWLDAFWRLDNKNTTGRCNSTMMVFVARLFALYALENDGFPSKTEQDSGDWEYLRLIDEHLLGVKGDEDYLPFKWFKSVLEHNGKDRTTRAKMLTRFAKWMNLFEGLDKESSASWLTPRWEKTTLEETTLNWQSFIEKFREGKAWRQYAALYAILSFFDHWEKWDETEFSEWMRVMWNIIENGSIDSFDPMQRFVKTCSLLARASKDEPVLEFLKSDQTQYGSFTTQIIEEITKAKLILNHGQRETIDAAEKLPWFKGRIRAIIPNEDIDDDLKNWFSEERVGKANTPERDAWVRTVICYIEQEYGKASENAQPLYFPVRSIRIRDVELKDAIYNENQGHWASEARGMNNDFVWDSSDWLKRMNGDDGEDGWKNRICISSYRDGVYAYRVSYITGAYRLDCKINWWHKFVKDVTEAKVNSWKTQDHGTWVQCEIEAGKYKGIYALCQDGLSSFIQRQTSSGEWYPSNEEAKQLWTNANGNWSSLLEILTKRKY